MKQIILDFYTYLGWAGSLIILICSLIAALAYRGKAGERYSIARHFVSELGERGVSRLAWVFNAGLIVGSFLLLLMMPGVEISLDSVWGSIGTAFGMLAALAFVFYASFLIHAGNVAKKQRALCSTPPGESADALLVDAVPGVDAGYFTILWFLVICAAR
jgi:hypothetical protein